MVSHEGGEAFTDIWRLKCPQNAREDSEILLEVTAMGRAHCHIFNSPYLLLTVGVIMSL